MKFTIVYKNGLEETKDLAPSEIDALAANNKIKFFYKAGSPKPSQPEVSIDSKRTGKGKLRDRNS